MTTSFSVPGARTVPVANFEYPDLSEPIEFAFAEQESAVADSLHALSAPPAVTEGYVTREEMEHRTAEALREGERRGLASGQVSLEKERERVSAAIEAFREEQAAYFGKVESELIGLSLAIAAKILHREAQVDRKLLGCAGQSGS